MFATLFLAFVIAQPPQAPPVYEPMLPPQAPPVYEPPLQAPPVQTPKAEPSKFQIALGKAKDENLPLIVYVSASPPAGTRIERANVIRMPLSHDPNGEECVEVYYPDGKGNWRYPAEVAEAQLIRDVATFHSKGTVQPSAIPFPSSNGSQRPASPPSKSLDRKLAAATADANSPWLSVGEHKHLWSLWPDGVPYPPTLAFYKLRPASQVVDQLVDGGGSHRRNPFHSAASHAENVNREFPYIGSGGMDWAKKGSWRNMTGMALPEGKRIEVWEHLKGIWNGSNFQNEMVLDWKFPDGTQMYDVLLRKNDDGSEHIFTVRMREKEGGKWSDGVSFFPDVPAGKETAYEHPGNRRTREALGVSKINYRVAETSKLPVGKIKFKESRTALSDGGHFFPPGFIGTGLSCTKCHSAGMTNEKAPYSGPMLRGMDTVFSWYPTLADSVSDQQFAREYKPRLDHRWPIRVVGSASIARGE